MPGITKELDILKQLFENLSDTDIRIPRGRRSVGMFNIQTINSYHSRLKNMIVHQFKGVATKYLNNYLVYHNFVNFAKDSLINKKMILLNFIRHTPCLVKSADISNRPSVPV